MQDKLPATINIPVDVWRPSMIQEAIMALYGHNETGQYDSKIADLQTTLEYNTGMRVDVFTGQLIAVNAPMKPINNITITEAFNVIAAWPADMESEYWEDFDVTCLRMRPEHLGHIIMQFLDHTHTSVRQNENKLTDHGIQFWRRVARTLGPDWASTMKSVSKFIVRNA